jgi:AraC-like DNA-binding protein
LSLTRQTGVSLRRRPRICALSLLSRAPLACRLPIAAKSAAGPAQLSTRSVEREQPTNRAALPSATGFAARLAVAVLRKHNVPTASLLKRAGVLEGDIDTRRNHISALAQGKLLEYAAEALGDDEFGLHLAEGANPREAGMLFYVASAAEDIGDALALAARYCRIGNEAVRLKLVRSPEGMIVETRFVGLPRHFAWQNTEFMIAIVIKALREMAGRDVQPTQVTFTLARHSALAEFERFFGCPVEFSASADQFSLSDETLALPLVTEDRHLLEALRPVCDEAAKERNTAHWTLRALVENEVRKLLPRGKANRQSVATALGLGARALSQRLAEERTSYDDVVDRLRHTLALQYIKEPSISLAQIAWLLGYEGLTSFNNAFMRWTGRPAAETRSERPNDEKATRPLRWAP